MRALLEAGIVPDLVVGTSVGAVNGAAVAADPTLAAVDKLTEVWRGLADSDVYAGGALRRARHLVRTRTHVHSNEPLRDLLIDHLGERRIEDLPVTFQCVAASIERAAEHWFTAGSLVDAVLASSAVPGVFPPIALGDEHFLDGGLVNSIPVGRALRLGARRTYVLQVGRIDRPLQAPTRPWEVASVAFEIARRHRFAREMAEIPPDVDVHVLPTGADEPPRVADLSTLRYRDAAQVEQRIDAAYRATVDFLERAPERTG
ncbi:MAG: patatin-like phospholipase family protein [Actinomycetes bacterium]